MASREPILDRVGQLICGIHGHDEVIEFDGPRMFLRCIRCGRESPGWSVTRRPPGSSGTGETPTSFEASRGDRRAA